MTRQVGFAAMGLFGLALCVLPAERSTRLMLLVAYPLLGFLAAGAWEGAPLAELMDDKFEVPVVRTRVGLDPIIGILPVAGDTFTAALSLYIVVQSALLGVRYRTLVRMLANIAVEVVIGSIPLVGDLFDAYWKANRRNVKLALRDLGAEQA